MCRSKLWSQVLSHKYRVCTDRWPTEIRTRTGSTTIIWKGITKAYNEVITPNIGRNVMNGRSTKFWSDKWLFEDELSVHCVGAITDAERELTVRDLWNPEFGWKWELINARLSSSCCLRLASVTLQDDWGKDDQVKWMCGSSGAFTTSSAHTFIANCRADYANAQGIYDCIWKTQGVGEG